MCVVSRHIMGSLLLGSGFIGRDVWGIRSRETTTFEREENWKFGSCNLKHQSTLTSTAIETFDIH
jgi:hypothetical protein